MSEGEKWGVGDQTGAKAFDTVPMGGAKIEIFHGQHPHSRRDNTDYARFPDGSVDAFNGKRPVVSFEFRGENYLKRSGLSGNEVRAGGQVRISFNGNCIYAKFCRDANRAAAMILSLLPRLLEHPVRLDWALRVHKDEVGRTDVMVGRLVYYREEPGEIIAWEPTAGEITIRAESGNFKVPCWALGHDVDPDDDRSTVRTDILDEHVYWHRDSPAECEDAGKGESG